MAYEIVTDSSSNLPREIIEKYNLPILPFKYTMNGVDYEVNSLASDIERKAFFYAMRINVEVTTSLVNMAEFLDCFEKIIKEGKDVLYIGMAAGISGTYNNACMAAEELREKYPGCKIALVDTKNASLGEGLPVIEALQMRDAGEPFESAVQKVNDLIPHTRGCFMVDDLMFLHRTGRVSGVVAIAGKALGIRPLLKGDDTGHIVVCGKVRGKRAALNTLIDDFEAHVIPDSHQTVAVAHCDALEDAQYVVDRISANPAVSKVYLEWYENVTGSHLGPGAVAMFYKADKR
jgi:DegV family protein with EDD domain